ncbi:MAG: tpl protein [Coriobacteriia bacterium]|nr:tpl protein [Coriobacteriia bacterium]
MAQAARIGFRHAPDLWFDTGGLMLVVDDVVIVETERSEEMGIVRELAAEAPVAALETDDGVTELTPVIRIATEDDMIFSLELREREKEALGPFRELIVKHNLEMKPVEVEYLFGGDKILFYFASENRVDFRQLVRDLAARFQARIEMRQIGNRDHARIVGGLGGCGDELCCARMSGEFKPVSIRMAKDQGLPPNPTKISGACGRLMCCLRYEVEAYQDFARRAPEQGALIETPKGKAKVCDLHALKELVTLQFRADEGDKPETMTVPLAAMTCSSSCSRPCKITKKDFDELAGETLDPLEMLPISFKGETKGKPETRKRRSRGGRRKRKGNDEAGSSPAPRKRRSRGGRSRAKKTASKPKQAGASSDVYVKQATRVPRRRRSS